MNFFNAVSMTVIDGKWLAVVVSFDLESSQYATMALRELMRTPTSPDFQATLNTSSLLEHEE
jgi:tRNA(Glu) U13 pseudouridine synthase TruD